jgi:hypothetical protein
MQPARRTFSRSTVPLRNPFSTVLSAAEADGFIFREQQVAGNAAIHVTYTSISA